MINLHFHWSWIPIVIIILFGIWYWNYCNHYHNDRFGFNGTVGCVVFFICILVAAVIGGVFLW